MQMNRRNVHKNAYSGSNKKRIGKPDLRGANLGDPSSKLGRGDFSRPPNGEDFGARSVERLSLPYPVSHASGARHKLYQILIDLVAQI
jgi:hypothetical protein